MRAHSRMIFSSVRVFVSFLLAVYLAAVIGAQESPRAKKTSDGNLTIDSSVTIVLNDGEPGPVEKAAQDLQVDLGKVLGKEPKIVRGAPAAGGAAIFIGEESKL